MTESSLEETAEKIFGSQDPAAVAHWVDYWNRGHERNLDLLRSFEEVFLLDLGKRRVLDAGCGVGSMGEVLRERCGHYVGVDVNRHVLRFSAPAARRSYVQASGLSLPFSERSFDCIFAFDVLEHLPGGLPNQIRFLTELRRVLKPMGTILFTTPNFWYPYDAHSRSYFAHYLPVRLADWIHRRRHPSFLKEHGSTANIPLLTPRRLRECIGASGLTLLHDLPCCLDRSQVFSAVPVEIHICQFGVGLVSARRVLGYPFPPLVPLQPPLEAQDPPGQDRWQLIAGCLGGLRLRNRLRAETLFPSTGPGLVRPRARAPGVPVDRPGSPLLPAGQEPRVAPADTRFQPPAESSSDLGQRNSSRRTPDAFNNGFRPQLFPSFLTT